MSDPVEIPCKVVVKREKICPTMHDYRISSFPIASMVWFDSKWRYRILPFDFDKIGCDSLGAEESALFAALGLTREVEAKYFTREVGGYVYVSWKEPSGTITDIWYSRSLVDGTWTITDFDRDCAHRKCEELNAK